MKNLAMPDYDFIDYLKFLGEQEAQELLPAQSFADTVEDFANHGFQVFGPELPWTKVSDAIRLRPGQLSIWAGRSGSGKSTMLGQVIAWRLASQTAVIASMEMQPAQTLFKMACQAAGCQPSGRWARDWLAFLHGKLWIYDQLDVVRSDRILGMVHYAFCEMGVDHVVIDSLTKCGFTRDDYDAQAKFINRLQWAAKRHGKHVHLVCHMRKSNGYQQVDGKDEIRGAGEITDLADNVFILTRNRDKEDAQRKSTKNLSLSSREQDALDEPDSFLTIGKNRDFGVEPKFGMWFHALSQQFIPSDAGRPMTCPAVHDAGKEVAA